jgi:hypothetical protein
MAEEGSADEWWASEYGTMDISVDDGPKCVLNVSDKPFDISDKEFGAMLNANSNNKPGRSRSIQHQYYRQNHVIYMFSCCVVLLLLCSSPQTESVDEAKKVVPNDESVLITKSNDESYNDDRFVIVIRQSFKKEEVIHEEVEDEPPGSSSAFHPNNVSHFILPNNQSTNHIISYHIIPYHTILCLFECCCCRHVTIAPRRGSITIICAKYW